MIAVKDFRCNGCGAPLPIPKNSKGHVKCPSCKTECVIEGLVKNAEIAAKENINSGYPLFAAPTALHRRLLTLLSASSSMPLDGFEKGEVVREEHYCVPAYCFYCNGTASFTYEVGNERSQTYTVDRGDRVEVRERTRVEWSPGSSSAAVSQTVFVPGNRKLADEIEKLYKYFDPNKLIDIEELDFPTDVETFTYNLPQPAAFTEYVVPGIEALLEEKAQDSIAKQNTRGFSMGGINIQKEAVRVFLGLYHVVFKYNGKEYSFWATGGLEDYINEGMPVDTQRQKELEAKKQAKAQAVASLPVPKTGWINFGKWICILVAVPALLLGLLMTCAADYFGSDAGYAATLAIVLGGGVVFLIGAILLGKLRAGKRAPYLAKKAEVEAQHQKEIDDFEAQPKMLLEELKKQKKALRGIYEELSGDASAFPA
jgi:hypothetical protein